MKNIQVNYFLYLLISIVLFSFYFIFFGLKLNIAKAEVIEPVVDIPTMVVFDTGGGDAGGDAGGGCGDGGGGGCGP